MLWPAAFVCGALAVVTIIFWRHLGTPSGLLARRGAAGNAAEPGDGVQCGSAPGPDPAVRAGLRQRRGAAAQGVAGEPHGFPGNSQFVRNHLIARGVMDAALQGTLPSLEKSTHDAVLIVGDRQPVQMGD